MSIWALIAGLPGLGIKKHLEENDFSVPVVALSQNINAYVMNNFIIICKLDLDHQRKNAGIIQGFLSINSIRPITIYRNYK